MRRYSAVALLMLALMSASLLAQEADVSDAVGLERAKRDDADIAAVVNFAIGSATLTAPSRRTLDAFVAQLPAGRHVEVDGHTDSSGAERLNNALSDQRARAVVAYLAAHGVAVDRVTPIGYGASQPVDTNDTDSGRAKNRRADLKILP